MAVTETMDVLLVEDDRVLTAGITRALREKGLSLDYAADAYEAFRLLSRKEYSVVLLDLILPAGSGFQIIDFIKSLDPRPRTVMVITSAEGGALARLDRSIVSTIIFKPLDFDRVAAYAHVAATSSSPPVGDLESTTPPS